MTNVVIVVVFHFEFVYFDGVGILKVFEYV